MLFRSPGAHGNLNLSSAIEHSCNDYFYEVGYRLSNDGNGYNADVGTAKLAYYADLFGLSEKSGVEILEADPQVSDTLPVVSAIGQGTHSYTTVGLARYVTAVANSGTCYNLTLVDKVTDANKSLLYNNEAEIRNIIDLPDSVWNAIQLGMKRVAERKSYFNELSVQVAGKTGTAQENTTRANHALFVGYAPYDEPEIAIATRIAYGYTSEYAAQISKDVIVYYYNLADKEDLITRTANLPIVSGGGGD